MSNDIFEVLGGLRSGLDDANRKLSQIQEALFGNREFGRTGIIQRLDEYEARLVKLERSRVSVWQLATVAVVLSAAGAVMHAPLFSALPSELLLLAGIGVVVFLSFILFSTHFHVR